jgi:glycogen synthase
MTLQADCNPRDWGNGFFFRDYDPGGLWYALEKSVQFHRRAPNTREIQMKRVMTETRERYQLKTMIEQYVQVYEKLNGGKPLA